jgi:hypothetical protein
MIVETEVNLILSWEKIAMPQRGRSGKRNSKICILS